MVVVVGVALPCCFGCCLLAVLGCCCWLVGCWAALLLRGLVWAVGLLAWLAWRLALAVGFGGWRFGGCGGGLLALAVLAVGCGRFGGWRWRLCGWLLAV